MGRGRVRTAPGRAATDQLDPLSLLGSLSFLGSLGFRAQLHGPAAQLPHEGERTTATNQVRAARPGFRYRIGIPDRVRAMTSRWISLVPSKMV